MMEGSPEVWEQLPVAFAMIVVVGMMLKYVMSRDQNIQEDQRAKDAATLETLSRLGSTCHEVQARSIDAIMAATAATAQQTAVMERAINVLDRVDRTLDAVEDDLRKRDSRRSLQ